MHEAVFFESMPPEDGVPLSKADRQLLNDWIGQELKPFGPSKLEDKLRRPDYGNRIDHAKLFSGEYKDLNGFTYDRRWLISEFIFDAKLNRIMEHNAPLDVDGKRVQVIGSNNRGHMRVNLTNPFLLPSGDGVRYYANETLNGGHLLTMITNAKEVSAYMMGLARKNKAYAPAVNAIVGQEWDQDSLIAARASLLDKFIDLF